MLWQSKKSAAAALLVGATVLGGLVMGVPRDHAKATAVGAITRSPRMVYRDGRRFWITLYRDAGFPAQWQALRRVVGTFTADDGAVTLWDNDPTLYLAHPTPGHATFGFKARGTTAGSLRITVDDDEIGPIPMDPTSADPCATPGPVGTKPRAPRQS